MQRPCSESMRARTIRQSAVVKTTAPGMSDRNLEQRGVIKFWVKNGKNPTDTLQHLRTAFGDHAMKKTSVFEWHKRFKDGRVNVRDDFRSGQPRTQRTEENVQRVRELVSEKEGMSVRGIAEELNLNRETVRKILNEELGAKRRYIPGIKLSSFFFTFA